MSVFTSFRGAFTGWKAPFSLASSAAVATRGRAKVFPLKGVQGPKPNSNVPHCTTGLEVIMLTLYGIWTWMNFGYGATKFLDITLPPQDAYATVCLTKIRDETPPGNAPLTAFCGIAQCNGADLSGDGYPPALFQPQMTSITFAITSDAQYAQGLFTLFRVG
jgi:hypothetical protein